MLSYSLSIALNYPSYNMCSFGFYYSWLLLVLYFILNYNNFINNYFYKINFQLTTSSTHAGLRRPDYCDWSEHFLSQQMARAYAYIELAFWTYAFYVDYD